MPSITCTANDALSCSLQDFRTPPGVPWVNNSFVIIQTSSLTQIHTEHKVLKNSYIVTEFSRKVTTVSFTGRFCVIHSLTTISENYIIKGHSSLGCALSRNTPVTVCLCSC